MVKYTVGSYPLYPKQQYIVLFGTKIPFATDALAASFIKNLRCKFRPSIKIMEPTVDGLQLGLLTRRFVNLLVAVKYN